MTNLAHRSMHSLPALALIAALGSATSLTLAQSTVPATPPGAQPLTVTDPAFSSGSGPAGTGSTSSSSSSRSSSSRPSAGSLGISNPAANSYNMQDDVPTAADTAGARPTARRAMPGNTGHVPSRPAMIDNPSLRNGAGNPGNTAAPTTGTAGTSMTGTGLSGGVGGTAGR